MAGKRALDLTAGTPLTANGSSGEFQWPGGVGQFDIWGTPDGAQMDLEYLIDDDSDTWLAVGGDAALTAAGGAKVTLAEGRVRATLSSAGASTSLEAKLTQV